MPLYCVLLHLVFVGHGSLMSSVVSVYGAIASSTELTSFMEYAKRGSLRSVRAANMPDSILTNYIINLLLSVLSDAT